MTHGDVIRLMPDKDLAELLTEVAKKSAEMLCESVKTVKLDLSRCDFEKLTETHLEWLKQEVHDVQSIH